MVDEIEFLVDKYKIEGLYFEDDNLTLNRRRMEKICDGILQRGIEIVWGCPNGVAINTLTPDLLSKMRKSGCQGLAFGIEHGDAEMRRRVVRKPINQSHAKKIVDACRKVGIGTTGFFIIGLPGETEQTYGKTVDFAKEVNFDFASFFMALPLPGSDLFDYAVKRENVSDLDDFASKMRMYGSDVPSLTDSFSSEDLVRLQKETYGKFLRHTIKRELKPRAIFNRIKRYRSIEKIRNAMNLLKRLLQVME